MTDIPQLIIVLVSVAGLMFGFFKWFIAYAERRHQSHDERFVNSDRRLRKTEEDLEKTREEMHRDFVRTAEMHQMRLEFREDFQKIFHKLGEMAKDMNQMIGELRSGRGKKR